MPIQPWRGRRGTPVIPPDVACVWCAHHMVRRVREIYDRLYVPVRRTGYVGGRQRRIGESPLARDRPPAVLAWAAELGIERHSFGNGTVYAERWVIRCPRCRRRVGRLIETPMGGRWGCRHCIAHPPRGLESVMADYVFCRRISYRGRGAIDTRRSVLQAAARLGARAKEPRELRRVAEAVALAAPKPGHFFLLRGRPLPRRRYDSGPVWEGLVPLVWPALVETLLHPRAFLARYGQRRAQCRDVREVTR